MQGRQLMLHGPALLWLCYLYRFTLTVLNSKKIPGSCRIRTEGTAERTDEVTKHVMGE